MRDYIVLWKGAEMIANDGIYSEIAESLTLETPDQRMNRLRTLQPI
jgi:hypothetical protein